ncbi:protein snakeskin [Atheta coriaria]|uniref:protein snakeskin n=1 Tax=Dalotia coriaria TaxID=877792 RepID=UPI0031F3BA8D
MAASSIMTVGSIFLKIFKLVLNLIILVLYRVGFHGGFLGVGGTWNLNEEKNPDAEIVASGVFVGYFIYTTVSLISYCFSTNDHKHSFTDILMNIIGTMMWLATGATALHYWTGYLSEYKFTATASERQVGLALGSLCVISGATYLLDSVLSVIHVIRSHQAKEEDDE